jgi:cyclic dehypoxanthinyl futalosine synthase
MDLQQLFHRVLNFEFLSVEEGMFLFQQAPLAELMFVADELAQKAGSARKSNLAD